ncbi:MAG: hypothetical protein HQM13_05835 [SAR324 cluster bacterium]|nr:hypothetical protein [SAR324 cluster bacterium]
MSSSIISNGIVAIVFLAVTCSLLFLIIKLFRKAHKLKTAGEATGLYVLLANILIPILILPALYSALYLMDFIEIFEKEYFQSNKPPQSVELSPGADGGKKDNEF